MSKLKIPILVLIATLILIQIIPTKRPEVDMSNPNDLLKNNDIDTEVASLLRASCYNCHSNETNYPWYAYVAPSKWLVSFDTKEGRHHLNFSDWESLNKLDKAKILSEIADEVRGGDMPMPVYTIMHPKARLSEKDRTQIIDWTNRFGDQLFSKK